MTTHYEGGCQCGAVRYRVTAEPTTLYLCHCTECRKQSSSAFGMSLWVPSNALEVTKGKVKTWTRPTDSGGTMACDFCGDCGSRLFHHASDESDTVSVKGGSLDDIDRFQPVGNIWTRSALPWAPKAPNGMDHATEPEDFSPLQQRFTEVNGG